MKKVAALILVTLFVASTLPAFAGTEPVKEKNLFQIIMDSCKPGTVKPKNQIRNPLPKVTAFQNAANGINEGSAKAKNETLRTEKAK